MSGPIEFHHSERRKRDKKSLSCGHMPVEEASIWTTGLSSSRSRYGSAGIGTMLPVRGSPSRQRENIELPTGCRGFTGPVPPPLLMNRFSSLVFNWRGYYHNWDKMSNQFLVPQRTPSHKVAGVGCTISGMHLFQCPLHLLGNGLPAPACSLRC